MSPVLKSEWVGPGRGASVRELVEWLGWNLDLASTHEDAPTELAIVRPGPPAPYDRERAVEALKRAAR